MNLKSIKYVLSFGEFNGIKLKINSRMKTETSPNIQKLTHFCNPWVKMNIKRTSKDIKRCLISLASREMKIKIMTRREFPGGLVVRIPGFDCCGLGSIPGQGTEIPRATWYGQKKKKKNHDEMTLHTY